LVSPTKDLRPLREIQIAVTFWIDDVLILAKTKEELEGSGKVKLRRVAKVMGVLVRVKKAWFPAIVLSRAGFQTLQQRKWKEATWVVRHNPRISQEDWVAYRNCSTHNKLCKDVFCERRAKILGVGCSPKNSATAEWYEPDPIMGVMTHTPLDNREVWHLDKQACFTLTTGEDHTKPNSRESSLNRDLYIIAGCDKNREKIKLTLEMIHIDDKDMRPIEQYGPAFI
jgi:hypothetical protein